MLLTPRLGNLGCLFERGAHRSAAFRIWIEPDWEFDGLVHHSAGAIVRFLYLVFDAQRLTGQFTDRYQRAPAQFTAERWFTALFAVAQHTDVKVVVDGVRFGATDAQIMNKLVEYRRELLGLPSARDRKSTRLNSSHDQISYAVFCLKKKKTEQNPSSREDSQQTKFRLASGPQR